MRAPFNILPLTFLVLTALPALAQETPRVLFCAGPCFAVDAKGVRTPAPKGTPITPGQRLETGPGGYAQVRMGRNAAIGIGDQARVRFERGTVVLDEGRLRMVGGAALGRPESAPVELRTGDGTLLLSSADVEVKKSGLAGAATTPTFVKLNAGDATLRSAQGDVALPRETVQGISAGRVMTGTVIPVAAVAPIARPTLTAGSTALAPVATVLPPLNISTLPVRNSIVLAPTISPTLSPTIIQTTLTPVVSTGDLLLRQPIVDSTTGITTTLTKVISEPVLTTTTTTTSLKSLTLQPISTTTTISPLLSTTTLIRR
jgi:hypothetical protein